MSHDHPTLPTDPAPPPTTAPAAPGPAASATPGAPLPGPSATDASPATSGLPAVKADPAPPAKPQEIGGPQGKEPTRYGDWERKGRCIDF